MVLLCRPERSIISIRITRDTCRLALEISLTTQRVVLALVTVGRSVGLSSDSPSESVLKMPDREFTLVLLSGVDLLDGRRGE